MVKIGVLSLYYNNYGGLLQAYALIFDITTSLAVFKNRKANGRSLQVCLQKYFWKTAFKSIS